MSSEQPTVPSRSPTARATLGRVSGSVPLLGHMVGFARNPVELMRRARVEGGPVAELKLMNKRVALLSGLEAQEAFCRAPDDQLSQKIAYRLMTPVFGEGVVFDAPIERLNEQLRILMPALRDRNMRTYADIFAAEVDGMVARWGEAGEIDLLDFTAELTTYTSSACLLGEEFRHGMNQEFARVYAALEGGVNAIAYINPYLPLPVFRRRDRARARLVEMITEIIGARQRDATPKHDALQVLMEARYSDGTALTPNEITGILTASMFAGHHTSSGTAAWTLIELLRHPEWFARVRTETDALHARDGSITYQGLREVPVLESVIKEVLRLHPPLVILMRGVLHDFHVAGVTVPSGHLVAISPAVSHTIPELFRDPERFNPERYGPGREEDAQTFGWIPFGGGAHRCSGSAFAMMQLKAITARLVHRWDFELAQPPATYENDYTKMVVQPRHPCNVRYRRRAAAANPIALERADQDRPAMAGSFRVQVDLQLCQGHATCVAETPEVFALNSDGTKVTLRSDLVANEHRTKVERAVRFCPTRALAIRAET